MLQSFDDWEVDVRTPNGDGDDDSVTVQYRVEYIYIGPDRQPRGVTREMLEPGPADADGLGQGDSWPQPGDYEIHVTGLDGNDLTAEPWRGSHFTQDSLTRRQEPGPASLYTTLCSDAEFAVRNLRAQVNAAELREKKAKDERVAAEAMVSKLMREKAQMALATERAIADREYAQAKQKEAEDELAAEREDVANGVPFVKMVIDEGVAHLTKAFGFSAPAVAAGNNNSERPVSYEPPPGEEWDPKPPGAEYPKACEDALFSLILDIDRCQFIVDNGLLTWQEVCAIYWHKTKINLGPAPKWDEWRAQAAETEKGAA